MYNSKIFQINAKDVIFGLVVALVAGFVLPILAMFQSPGFDIAHANWSAILNLGFNGAVAGFASFITTKFFTDSQGTPLGHADSVK